MLDAFDQTVLDDSPQFASLYKSLTEEKLNHDGSTKDAKFESQRKATQQALREQHIPSIRTTILKHFLDTLPLDPPPSQPCLPPELSQVILLLNLQQSASPRHSTDRALLATDSTYSALPDHIPRIAQLLSSHIRTQILTIARLLSPTTNPSYLHRQIPLIPSRFSTLQRNIQDEAVALSTARTALIRLLNTTLQAETQALTTTISILESTQHGLYARHSRVTASTLSLRATAVLQELRIKEREVVKEVYTPEVRSALAAYGEHLKDGLGRLKEREVQARRVLERYGVGVEGEERRERELRELGADWEELVDAVEGLRKEIARLERGR